MGYMLIKVGSSTDKRLCVPITTAHGFLVGLPKYVNLKCRELLWQRSTLSLSLNNFQKWVVTKLQTNESSTNMVYSKVNYFNGNCNFIVSSVRIAQNCENE